MKVIDLINTLKKSDPEATVVTFSPHGIINAPDLQICGRDKVVSEIRSYMSSRALAVSITIEDAVERLACLDNLTASEAIKEYSITQTQ